MATYRIDPDLAFIGQCSNEDLGLLVSVLTHDSKDGKKRLAESLTASPEYQLFYPDHQKYCLLSVPNCRPSGPTVWSRCCAATRACSTVKSCTMSATS